MVRPGRELLKSRVEVDETFLAIRAKAEPTPRKGKKSHSTKTLMISAVEMLEPKGFGRIRLRQIPVDSALHVIPFVQDVIQPGSTVHTDGFAAYRSLEELGYTHRHTVMANAAMPAHVSMPGVHRVAALVQRWLLGTRHGAVKPEQLDHYLDEFVFRFNRRTSLFRGILFYRLLGQAVLTDPVTYRGIASKKIAPVSG